MNVLKVGIAGYGVVGKRRHHFIDLHPNLEVVAVCDQFYSESGVDKNGLKFHTNYKQLLKEELDVLFVCLPNNLASEVTIEGLKKNLHVFCEKPPGKSIEDIEEVIKVENQFPELKLKYGFNHRYHDSVRHALNLIKSGELGQVHNIRGVYGKSKIIPFSGGWRSEREMAGGGILLDQGIHMVDLMQLFCSNFVEIKSFVDNSYWKHDVEDNAFAIMKDDKGRIAMLHSSATQWQHRFKLDITLTEGYIELHGILSGSKSYGEEKIVVGTRDDESINGQMAYQTIQFLEDSSWKDEIWEFADSIVNDIDIKSGTSQDALDSMKIVFGIYENDKEWNEKIKTNNF